MVLQRVARRTQTANREPSFCHRDLLLHGKIFLPTVPTYVNAEIQLILDWIVHLLFPTVERTTYIPPLVHNLSLRALLAFLRVV